MITTGRGRLRLHDAGRGLLAGGVTLAVAGLLLGFADLARVGLVAALLPMAMAALLLLSRPRLEVERRLPLERPEVGAEARIDVLVHNRGRRSPAVRVEERLSPGLGSTLRVAHLPPLPAGHRTRLTLPVRARHRGRHVLGPAQLVRADPFGLASVSYDGPEQEELIAVPRIHPLGDTSVRPDSPGADGPAPAAITVHGEEDAAIRGYEIGDDLRRIHWPLTAHRGDLMVRQEGRPRTRRAALVLDPRLPAPDGRSAALDWAVEALGSVATHLDGHGYELRLVADPRAEIEDRRHARDELPAILQTLALLEPHPHPAPPTAAVEDPFLTAAREAIDSTGLVVLAVSSHDPMTAHHLLGLLPAAGAGRVFLLDHGAFASGSPDPAVDAVLDTARYSGWAPVPVTPQTPVVDAWTRLGTLGTGSRP